MKIAVRYSEAFVLNLKARLPFRYGIATMTRLPHFILRLQVEVDGRIVEGFSADNLPPKWFTKNPSTPFRDDLLEMLAVIGNARKAALEIGAQPSVFAFWELLYSAQKAWAADDYPPLLWNFGVSLVERAVINAFCRAKGMTFAQAVRENAFAIELSAIFSELTGLQPADLLPREPLRTTIVRHTVGLTDALTKSQIATEDRANDGLPEDLETYLRIDGITHLKIKLGGSVDTDLARLREISALLESVGGRYAFTLDGNENFNAIEPFQHLWDELRSDPIIDSFLEGLIFVEQPFHRDVALAEETCEALRKWKNRPPIIIDESDSSVGVLTNALEGGYVGTSHKNCKGVFKGVANACLLSQRQRKNPGENYRMSAEDLTNVGPIALPADLAVLATLGIPHAERNGHHYFAGLSQFPAEIQREVLRAHSDLYRVHPAGYPTLRIDAGRIAIGSAVDAPMGFAGAWNAQGFTPLESWNVDSLGL